MPIKPEPLSDSGLAQAASIAIHLSRDPQTWWDDEHVLDAAHAAVYIRRLLATVDDLRDPFNWKGTWHVRHADGTTEDIVLEHGNLVEDESGSCGQFFLEFAPTPNKET